MLAGGRGGDSLALACLLSLVSQGRINVGGGQIGIGFEQIGACPSGSDKALHKINGEYGARNMGLAAQNGGVGLNAWAAGCGKC